MILIDSNIIIYSINPSSTKHQAAQRFLQERKKDLFIAHQNILESLRVLTHPKYPDPMKVNDAIRSILDIADVSTVIFPALGTYNLAVELIKKHRLKPDEVFDAYLAATMLSNGIDVIATDNEIDFAKIKEIKVLNPFKLAS